MWNIGEKLKMKTRKIKIITKSGNQVRLTVKWNYKYTMKVNIDRYIKPVVDEDFIVVFPEGGTFIDRAWKEWGHVYDCQKY